MSYEFKCTPSAWCDWTEKKTSDPDLLDSAAFQTQSFKASVETWWVEIENFSSVTAAITATAASAVAALRLHLIFTINSNSSHECVTLSNKTLTPTQKKRIHTHEFWFCCHWRHSTACSNQTPDNKTYNMIIIKISIRSRKKILINDTFDCSGWWSGVVIPEASVSCSTKTTEHERQDLREI